MRLLGGSNHLELCLDYIRQGIMCLADTTIEWPPFVKSAFQTDGTIAVEGIERQCRDREAMGKFAAEMVI